MQKLILISTLFAAAALSGIAQTPAPANPNLPSNWNTTGNNPEGYEFSVDRTTKHGGNASASIKAKPNADKEKFGSLVQAIRADKYRGKRIRLSGYMKTENVSGAAHFWVRADGTNNQQLDFSNMDDRPVTGTTNWTKYDRVIDVAPNTDVILFGAFLVGPTGQIWVDDLKLEAVGNDVAKTSNKISDEERAEHAKQIEAYVKQTAKEELDRRAARNRARPPEPINLDFEAASSSAASADKKPDGR